MVVYRDQEGTDPSGEWYKIALDGTRLTGLAMCKSVY